MPTTPTGVLWPSFAPEDGTRIRKWLYGSVLIRDWDSAGTTNMVNIPVFSANGNLNPALLLPVAQGGYGFYDVGNITEAGVEFTPNFAADETYVWQSRKSQRTDITKDDEEVMFSAADSTPLVDYLWYNLPIGFTGVPLFPALGSANYNVSKPFYSDVVYRQLLIIGVDGSVGPGGQPEYIIELRPRVSLSKKAKKQWGPKQIDATELTWTCHVDPFTGYDMATLRGGIVWVNEGGIPTFNSPNFISLSPLSANTATVSPGTLTQTPSGSGGTFTAGTYFWVITATTAGGESLRSNEVTTTLSGSTSSNALAWPAVTGATGYKVYRGTTAGGESALITTIGSGATVTYTDTGTAGSAGTPPTLNSAVLLAPTSLASTPSATGGLLAAGATYWVVTALNANGETTRSNEVNATLTGSGTASDALSWSAVTGATGYRIYRGTTVGSEIYLAGQTTSTSFTDTGTAVAATALAGSQALIQFQQPGVQDAPFTYAVAKTTGGVTSAATVVTAAAATGSGLTSITVGSLTGSNVYTFTITVTGANLAANVYPASNSITST